MGNSAVVSVGMPGRMPPLDPDKTQMSAQDGLQPATDSGMPPEGNDSTLTPGQMPTNASAMIAAARREADFGVDGW
jgi:hypothetical protein